MSINDNISYNGIEVTSSADKYVYKKEREEHKETLNRLNELSKAVEDARLENIKITAKMEVREQDYYKLLNEDRKNLINIINELKSDNDKLKINQK